MIGHLDVPRFDGPALCAETDPDSFFPEKGGTTRTAKALCNGDATRDACPIKDECLTWALDRGERYGIWGGLSERERRRLRPQAPVVAVRGPYRKREIHHGTEAGYKAHRRLGEEPCAQCTEGLRLAGARRRAARAERGAA